MTDRRRADCRRIHVYSEHQTTDSRPVSGLIGPIQDRLANRANLNLLGFVPGHAHAGMKLGADRARQPAPKPGPAGLMY